MAALSDTLGFSRTQSQTDSVGLSNANGITFANEALLDFRRRLLAAGVDASQLQESYADGVVPTGNNGSTFLYPSDMFWLKTIEVNFTDSSAEGYKKAKQIDIANLPDNASFLWLRENASTAQPLFDDRGDWYEIFPRFTSGLNLTQAIRLVYFLEPTEYTAVGDTIAYPESLDYRIIGWRIAANYKRSISDFDSATAFDAEYDERVTQLIATLSRGSQQPIQATEPSLGNNGWDF